MTVLRYVTLLLLPLLTATGCSRSATPVEIPFIAQLNGVDLECDRRAAPYLTDLRFYIQDPAFTDADGRSHPVQLEPNDWQQPGLAFIDLENGAGTCLNGTTEYRAVIRGSVRADNLKGLRFSLGVPFEQNHADPLLAAAPLGDADMHWHWRGGYKFFRAGVRTDNDSFWVHLGSTGCEGTIRNITGCNAPNRVVVWLENFTPGDTVSVDLGPLVAGDVLLDAEPGSCSSGPAETDCAAAFAAFGLVHATATGTANQQQVFSRRAER